MIKFVALLAYWGVKKTQDNRRGSKANTKNQIYLLSRQCLDSLKFRFEIRFTDQHKK